MTIEESTTIESTDELEDEGSVFGTDESTLEDVDGADGADASDDVDQEDPEIQRLLAEHEATKKLIQDAREARQLEARTKEFRELAEEEREKWLADAYVGEKARDEFLEHIAQVDRTEQVQEILALNGDARIEAARKTDDATRELLEATLEEAGDTEGLREIQTRITEPVVELPTPEPTEEGAEPQKIDYAEVWRSGPLSEITEDLEGHVQQALAKIDRGEIRLDSAAQAQLDELRADPGLSYPGTHSHNRRAQEALAGFASWAADTWAENAPFGTVTKTTQFTRPDGKYVIRSFSDLGKTRDQVVDEPVFAVDAGLAKERLEPDANTDYENMPVDQAMRLGPTGWAKFREANPDKAEEALRAASAAMTEASLQARRRGEL